MIRACIYEIYKYYKLAFVVKSTKLPWNKSWHFILKEADVDELSANRKAAGVITWLGIKVRVHEELTAEVETVSVSRVEDA